jgi:GNAT superfamily N-acetyltransferase
LTAVQVALVAAPQHASLVDLLLELHAYYNAGTPIPKTLVHSYLVDQLLAADSPLRLAVALTENGGVAGFAAISLTWSLMDPAPERRRHCWLKELYVAESQRSLGVGMALMAWVGRYAVDNGCWRIDWPVQAANARGIAFYEGLGAQRVAERIGYRLSGPALHALAERYSG